jgi:hypothetical protein
MKLHDLSRCTGFPCAVLRAFAVQGILPARQSSSLNDATVVDGKTFLRKLVELENGR